MAQRASLDRVNLSSAHPNDERIAALRELVPEAFSEGRIDWERLRAALGDAIDERPERYSFTWAGKRDALRLLQMPTRATLAPAEAESVAWDTTHNVFIEGDNLEALKLLYKPYFGRVKMIYIDPPYNTGNDFIYPDDFTDPLGAYLTLTGQQDAGGNLLTSNPETSGRYHSAWLSMMYPRLFLARQLLRDDGVILISIDDVEIANLRMMLNEIFGEENFLAHLVWQKRYVSNATAQFLSDMHDHILVYARQRDCVRVNRLERTEEQLKDYKNPDNDERGVWRPQDLSASKPYSAGLFTIIGPMGQSFNPPPGRYWRCNEAQYKEWLADNRIWFGKDKTGRPMLKAFLSESQQGVTPNTWWSFDFAGHNKEATLEVKELFGGAAPFDTPKPVKLIKRMLELFSDRDSLVLDFFAGACTTAQAVVEYNREDGGNRRFIVVQFPEPTPEGSTARDMGLETIADIGKERIRRVIARIEQSKRERLDLPIGETADDLGFRVFTLAPSNFRAWQGVAAPEPDAYAEQMALFTDLLVGAWQPEDVIWEAALKEGFSLDARVERVDGCIANAVYRVTDPGRAQSFYICLDAELRPETPAALGLSRDDLFICRDAALSDELAANLALQCRLKVL